MTDFDPNVEPSTQDEANAYVHWCAENFTRLSVSGPWTYRTALRCAHWLLVVAVAQLHLEGDVDNREALLEQLAAGVEQRPHVRGVDIPQLDERVALDQQQRRHGVLGG